MPIANESQTAAVEEIPGQSRTSHTGHTKSHVTNIVEALSLNKALTKSRVIKRPTTTTIPVAIDAKISFMWFQK